MQYSGEDRTLHSTARERKSMNYVMISTSLFLYLPYCNLPYPTIPCPTLPYPTLTYPTLPHPTLPYPILPYTILTYPTLPYRNLSYPALPYPTVTCPLWLLLNNVTHKTLHTFVRYFVTCSVVEAGYVLP